jgi:hypothetical protein
MFVKSITLTGGNADRVYLGSIDITSYTSLISHTHCPEVAEIAWV